MLFVEVDKKLERTWSPMKGTYKLNSQLIEGIEICEFANRNDTQFEGFVEISDTKNIYIYSYELSNNAIYEELFNDYKLPNINFIENWSKIVYNEEFKYEILSNITKTMNLNKEISSLMGINKLVLIHGDPGLGKTTFSRGICQKYAIRSNNTKTLREINCSKILSRFYGESIKNLSRILNQDPNIIYILDEADSLFMDRSLIMDKNEPNDSIRIINYFLKVIDTSNNLFILITNFKDQIDKALLDRCDFIVKMEPLGFETTYKMMKDTLEKLMEMRYLKFHQFNEFTHKIIDENSVALLNISKQLENASPRKIKKIIFESSKEMDDVKSVLCNITNKLNK